MVIPVNIYHQNMFYIELAVAEWLRVGTRVDCIHSVREFEACLALPTGIEPNWFQSIQGLAPSSLALTAISAQYEPC